MKRRWLLVLRVTFLLAFAGEAVAQTSLSLQQLNAAQPFQRVEFRILQVPNAPNPFDPDLITVDGTFTSPSGRSVIVPAFWFQQYQRSKTSAGAEYLAKVGSPEWRLRFAPQETGTFSVSVQVRTNGNAFGEHGSINFTVSGTNASGRGYVGVGAGRQYLVEGQEKPLPLMGENVCWHGKAGTYDYDAWFGAGSSAGCNYARLWMWPSAFGLETDANSLTRYRLDRAWQLDYVFQLAEAKSIWLLLCLDYHGMFEEKPDYWGGNNYWPLHPYNATNGGPCATQNEFFTSDAAKKVYKKRLRYLVARYGYSPNLVAWQFFNEIDNVYSYLKPADVAAWHGNIGAWLHANDPYGHLVTTSLTGSSDRPEIWSIPEMDFAAYHSYSAASPASKLASISADFRKRYGKPVLIDEFGTDWRGWNRAGDPYLRGFRQGIWGGALGESMGTSMPWFWESIHSDKAYPVFTALKSILSRTSWGRGSWTNISFATSGPPPVRVGIVVGGAAFDLLLDPDDGWGSNPAGQLAVAQPLAASFAPRTLNGFVHGSSHSDLRVPFRIDGWFTNSARLTLHLNSVSSGATMLVRSDGEELFRTNLPNLDGTWAVNNEYNIDLSVDIPAGKHLLEVYNPGADWFFLDWVRLERVVPAAYEGGWQASPEAIGLKGVREALLYALYADVSFPSGATNAEPAIKDGKSVTLTNWPAGTFQVEWWNPSTGARIASEQGVSTNRSLTLRLPPFREDLAGIIVPTSYLTALGRDTSGSLQFVFSSDAGGRYTIEKSQDLQIWRSILSLTNDTGSNVLSEPASDQETSGFLRARLDD